MVESAQDVAGDDAAAALNRSAMWGIFLQAEMGPCRVVIRSVFLQDALKMGLAPHDYVVKTLASDRADCALDISVLPWRSRRDRAVANAHRRQGAPDALDSVTVRHVSGGQSTLGFESYDQGRTKWQGETLDFVWFDEEPPQDIYFEGLTRTNATDGMVYLTFTPLKGAAPCRRTRARLRARRGRR
jgi:phage terminase large subunit-like protein